MLDIKAALPLLNEPRKIFITTHHKPDGDAMGSALGLYHYLKQIGHDPTVVSPSAVPDFLMWMPGMETVLNFEAEAKAALAALENSDLIFCLDFNRLDRVKALETPLRESTQPKILIDHHLLPELPVFNYGSSQPGKSSTCEMVYDFILLNNGRDYLSQAVMQCLYTGLMTDTGSFRFPVASASVHAMVADFKNRGLEHGPIHEEVFDVWSEKRMRFLGYILYKKMEIYPEQKTGIIAISGKELAQFEVSAGDTEGVVNYPLSIAGITTSILMIERKDEVKLSFRSKGDIDVSALAREHFEGGGHFNAAGGRSRVSLNDTITKIKTLLTL
jgi:phosphoesterase RecJ-like protein